MIKKWWLTVLTSLALSLGTWGGGPTTHAVELETSTPTSLTAPATPAVNATPASLTASNPTVVLPVMAAPPRSRTSLLISPAAPAQLTTNTPADDQPTPVAAVQSVKSTATLAPSPAKPSPPPSVLSPVSPAASSTAGATLALPLTNQRKIAPAPRQPLLARGHHPLKPNLAKEPVSAPALTRQLPLNSTPAAPPHDQPLWQWGVIGSLVVLIGLLGGQIARRRYPKAPPFE